MSRLTSTLKCAGIAVTLALSQAAAEPNLVGWGKIWNGEATVPFTIPNDLDDVIAAASGLSHTLALRRDGTVAVWGTNTDGQLDVAADLTDVVQVAAGERHNLALRSTGEVVGWGANDLGQLKMPEGLTDIVRIAAGADHNLALRADGTVVAWGDDEFGQTTLPEPPDELGNTVVDIAASANQSVALLADGSLRIWPSQGGSSVPIVSELPNLADGVALAAGRDHMLVLRANGTVRAWGAHFAQQISVPEGLTDVCAIAASGDHSLALKSNGTMVAWGHDWAGQTAIPSNLAPVSAIVAGNARTLALFSDQGPPLVRGPFTDRRLRTGGNLHLYAQAVGAAPLSYQWHRDGTPVRGATSPILNLTDLTTRDAGMYTLEVTNALGRSESPPIHVRVVITIAPNVVAWSPLGLGRTIAGFPEDIDRVPAALTDAIAVSSGRLFNLVLRENGTVIAWGTNDRGEISVPRNLRDVVMISAGWRHSLALRSDGTVVAWGLNESGQAGVPADLTDVVSIDAGLRHNVALREDGTVRAWGNNEIGQTNVPENLTGVVAVAAGFSQTLALLANGTVMGWGEGGPWQPPITDVVAIASGRVNLALKRNGTVFAWGSNYASFRDVPAGLDDVVALGRGEFPSAIRADGTPVTWGDNQSLFSMGGDRFPPGLRPLAQVSVREYNGIALVQSDKPKRRPVIGEVTWQADALINAFPTERGQVYQLEFTDSLRSGLWSAMPLILGDGTTLNFRGPAKPEGQRYYRIRRW